MRHLHAIYLLDHRGGGGRGAYTHRNFPNVDLIYAFAWQESVPGYMVFLNTSSYTDAVAEKRTYMILLKSFQRSTYAHSLLFSCLRYVFGI